MNILYFDPWGYNPFLRKRFKEPCNCGTAPCLGFFDLKLALGLGFRVYGRACHWVSPASDVGSDVLMKPFGKSRCPWSSQVTEDLG